MQSICLASFAEKEQLAPFSYKLSPKGELDVIVRITHCGVCHSDIHQIDNDWGFSTFPLVPGHEIIGIIEDIGAKVEGLKKGDRVGIGPQIGSCGKCSECKDSLEQYCPRIIPTYNSKDSHGNPTYGGFSTLILANSKFAFKIPDNLPSDASAPLLCAGLTVFSPLKLWTSPGDKIGIIGIGGLGHLAIQFGKALGCNVVAISSSKDKENEAKSLGANEFVCSEDKKEMQKHKRSLKFILCCVSSQLNWTSFLSLLVLDGRFCLVGAPSGMMEILPFQLMARRISLCGSNIGSPKEAKEMFEVASKHNIKAQIETFPLSEANTALKRVKENKVRYRCVLKCSETSKL